MSFNLESEERVKPNCKAMLNIGEASMILMKEVTGKMNLQMIAYVIAPIKGIYMHDVF